jgi:hypothetical protein
MEGIKNFFKKKMGNDKIKDAAMMLIHNRVKDKLLCS